MLLSNINSKMLNNMKKINYYDPSIFFEAFISYFNLFGEGYTVYFYYFIRNLIMCVE